MPDRRADKINSIQSPGSLREEISSVAIQVCVDVRRTQAPESKKSKSGKHN